MTKDLSNFAKGPSFSPEDIKPPINRANMHVINDIGRLFYAEMQIVC